MSNYEDDYYDEDERTYERYNGSYAQDVEGYDDDTIDEVFDGDPDAYWNIDYTMKIPGMSFSWKRALGVSKIKQNISRATGIPMTRSGLEKKIGNAVLKTIFGKRK
mgnify:CR=1 FL=1